MHKHTCEVGFDFACSNIAEWHHVMFVSGPLQVHVGTSHQEQRVVGYLTCTHLHAIEGTVTCSKGVHALSLLLSFCLTKAQMHKYMHMQMHT